MGYPMRILTETMKTIVPRSPLWPPRDEDRTRNAGRRCLRPQLRGSVAGDDGGGLPQRDESGGCGAHHRKEWQRQLEAVDAYLARAVTLEAMDGAMRAIEPHIRKGEGVQADDKEWMSIMCGLNKVTSNTSDRAVCWVSDDAVGQFKKNGKAALASNITA